MKVLWCDSAVKRCMANMWIPSILQHSKKTYEIIIQVCLLLHSEIQVFYRLSMYFILCVISSFFCRLNQISYDILYTSLSFFTLLRTRRNSWSIASPASPAPWSSTSPGPMLQIWHPRGTRKPWNSSSVVTAFLGTSLGCLKLICKCR